MLIIEQQEEANICPFFEQSLLEPCGMAQQEPVAHRSPGRNQGHAAAMEIQARIELGKQ
jgi:hypothetical protein